MAYGDVLVHTNGPSYGQNIVRNVGVSSGGGGGGAPDAHKVSHQDGGSDELDLTGLSGGFQNPFPDPVEFLSTLKVSGASVLLETDDSVGDYILKIQAPVGYHQSSGDGYLIQIFAGDGTEIMNFDPSGTLNISDSVEESYQANINLMRAGELGNNTVIRAGGAPANDRIAISDATRNVMRVLASGAVAIGANAAPIDADVGVGHMILWFDPANGAAKLKVKSKQADGTVVFGELALA